MAVEVTTLVKLARLGSPTLKAVAWAMADYANKEGAGVYPSNNTIADDTELSRGCVISTINTLTSLGILRHDERSLGGAHRATTIREFDLEKLLEISRGHRKIGIAAGPSEVRKVTGIDGKPAFAIVAVGTDPVQSDADDDASGAAGGQSKALETVDQSSTMTGHPGGPVIHDDPTGHPGGLHESSTMTQTVKNRPRTVTPPTPKGEPGGDGVSKVRYSKRWSAAGIEAINEVRASVTGCHVASHLIDLVCGTQGPPVDADPEMYVRQLLARLKDFSPEVLRAVAESPAVIDRIRDMLPVPTLVAIARAEAAKRGLDSASPGHGQPAAAGDPALVAKWPDVRAALVETLGANVVASWFGGVVPTGIADGRLTLAVAQKFPRTYLAQHFEGATARAAARVLPGVASVEFVLDGADAGGHPKRQQESAA